MPVYRIAPEKMAEVQETLRRNAVAEDRPPANVEAATTAHDPGWLEYRGRRYRVPPVPWRIALELRQLRILYDRTVTLHRDTLESEPEVLRELLGYVEEILVTMARLVSRPWWWRLLHPRAPWNPFADAHEYEVATLLSFFSMCPTTSIVRAAWGSAASPRYRRMWPTPSASLPAPIRAG